MSWRGLSLRQPWAWIVLHLRKDIENRPWATRVRGDFLVHAAIAMTPEYYDAAIAFVDKAAGTAAARTVPAMDALPRGGFVGRARIAGAIPPCTEGAPCNRVWHMHEQHGFLLEDARVLPFVPYRGSLNFFRVPPDIVAALGLPPEPRT